jgi:hypothetical protein
MLNAARWDIRLDWAMMVQPTLLTKQSASIGEFEHGTTTTSYTVAVCVQLVKIYRIRSVCASRRPDCSVRLFYNGVQQCDSHFTPNLLHSSKQACACSR